MTIDTTAFIGLGSNLGNSLVTLQEAWQAISNNPGIRCVELSSPYQSSPVGMESENLFTNAVGQVKTNLPAEVLLDYLLTVEHDFGRRRTAGAGYQDRSLDLDLLYFGDLHQSSSKLSLPHPEIYNRLFVLSPMKEIAADWYDNSVNKNIGTLEKQLHERISEGEMASQEIHRINWSTDI